MYSVYGRTAATAATADHAIAEMWNPHATQRIKLLSFSIFKEAAGTAADGIKLRRSSAKGTSGSTVTPDIDHHSEQGAAPVSGVTLELAAFSVQPTLVATSDIPPGWVAAAIAGAGITYAFPGGLIVPPGAGLVITQRAATIWPISLIGFTWLEDW